MSRRLGKPGDLCELAERRLPSHQPAYDSHPRRVAQRLPEPHYTLFEVRPGACVVLDRVADDPCVTVLAEEQ